MSFAAPARNWARNWAGICVVAAATAFSAVPARSQEISDSHLAAARDAVTAIRVTDRFDTILPGAAVALKTEMLRQNPNLETLINETVDAKTLAMANRRGDLEREAALAFARAFTEDELKAISVFYNTDAGKKFIDKGPEATGEVYKAAEIWQRGIVRDLAQSVNEEMRRKAPPVQDPATAGVQPTAPANADDAPAQPAPQP